MRRTGNNRRSGPPVVLIGLDTIVGLQTARTLHAHGIRVVAIAADRRHYCAVTRTVDEMIEAPTAGPGLLVALEALAARLPSGSPLLPCRDPSVRTISEHRHELGHFEIRLPDHEVLIDLADKSRFAALAAGTGLHVPRSVTFEPGADVDSLVAALRFPLFVKPVERDDRWQDSGQEKAFEVADLAGLHDVLRVATRHAERFIIQERIPGPVTVQFTSNSVFGEDGAHLGTFTSQKLRQWPEATGSGCAGRAAIDSELRDLAVEFFTSVGMRGLAYLEAKRDERDGRLVMIEANIGRPTGRSALADRLGVDLLRAWYEDATGVAVEPVVEQPPSDATWVFLRADLQAGHRQWRRGELSLRDWFGTYRRARSYAVLGARDLRPVVADIRRVGRRRAARHEL